MALGLLVGETTLEIGTPSFLKAWFSTIYVRLENKNWGSRYPTIMRDFYSGLLTYSRAEAALAELESIRQEFSGISPGEVVWDFEDLNATPPWGLEISSNIVSMEDYFVTADGKRLMSVLCTAFSEALAQKIDVVIA